MHSFHMHHDIILDVFIYIINCFYALLLSINIKMFNTFYITRKRNMKKINKKIIADIVYREK